MFGSVAIQPRIVNVVTCVSEGARHTNGLQKCNATISKNLVSYLTARGRMPRGRRRENPGGSPKQLPGVPGPQGLDHHHARPANTHMI